jgi:hypothetical protein
MTIDLANQVAVGDVEGKNPPVDGADLEDLSRLEFMETEGLCLFRRNWALDPVKMGSGIGA